MEDDVFGKVKTERVLENVEIPPELKAFLSKTRVTHSLSNAKKICKIALQRQLMDNLEFKFWYPRLRCDGICKTVGCKDFSVSVGDPEYYVQNATTRRWWESDLIASFAQLLAHDIHRDDIVVEHCHYPNGQKPSEGERIQLPASVHTILAVAYAGQHYALLEFCLQELRVFVTDGLSLGLDHWADHASFLLWRNGLMDEAEQIRVGNPPSVLTRQNKWHLVQCRDRSLIQDDTWNCAPIACAELWKILDPEIKSVFEGKSFDEYRGIIIKHFNLLLDKHSKDLLVGYRQDTFDLSGDDFDDVDDASENAVSVWSLLRKH
jgi:hypothetical protein